MCTHSQWELNYNLLKFLRCDWLRRTVSRICNTSVDQSELEESLILLYFTLWYFPPALPSSFLTHLPYLFTSFGGTFGGNLTYRYGANRTGRRHIHTGSSYVSLSLLDKWKWEEGKGKGSGVVELYTYTPATNILNPIRGLLVDTLRSSLKPTETHTTRLSPLKKTILNSIT